MQLLLLLNINANQLQNSLGLRVVDKHCKVREQAVTCLVKLFTALYCFHNNRDNKLIS